MNKYMFLTSIIIFVCFIAVYYVFSSAEEYILRLDVADTSDVVRLFPRTVKDLESLNKKAQEQLKKDIQSIINQPNDTRTFENTMHAFDQALLKFSVALSLCEALMYVSPDDAVRVQAQVVSTQLKQLYVDTVGQNLALYNALKSYAEHNASKESLNAEQEYFISETMKDYKRNGLDLPDAQRAQVKQLQKELAELTLEFEKNINSDTTTIALSKEELAGLDDDFIANLKKNDQAQYLVGVDYPTFDAVMQKCAIESTRRALYTAFNNRAYPQNVTLLETIIAKRDELAHLLGYASYAALDIDSQMAQTPVRVETFLKEVLKKADVKEAEEFALLRQDLPASVNLTPEGKINAWDYAFATESYKKKYFNIDEFQIAEYFPMEKTVDGLLDIYKQFFDLELKEVSISGLWHPDVKMIEVYHHGTLLGYLALDLFPRANKYTHACQITIIPALKTKDEIKPAIAVVIANFPKSTDTKPSLLKRHDVKTFFHEFGHALHAILGATEIASQSGTQVKTDFVEMPSQMLEDWLYDKDMLKKVSGHYQTGNPLPDETINTLIELKNFKVGGFLQRQIALSFLSLDCFKEGSQKDITALMQKLFNDICKHSASDKENHMQASFGHLMGYGSKYYSYLWAMVFAKDLFAYIRDYGLLNSAIGQRYIDTVLGKGGSKDPNELLKDFLGREANQQAFLQDLGLN